MKQAIPEPDLQIPIFPLIEKATSPILQSVEIILGRELVSTTYEEAETKYLELCQMLNPDKKKFQEAIEDLVYISYFQLFSLFQIWIGKIYQGVNDELDIKDLDEYKGLVLPSTQLYYHCEFALKAAEKFNYIFLKPDLSSLFQKIKALNDELWKFYHILNVLKEYYMPFKVGQLLRNYANFLNNSGMDVNVFDEVVRLYGIFGGINTTQIPPVLYFDENMMRYYFLAEEGYFHGVGGTYVNFPRFDLVNYYLINQFKYTEDNAKQFMDKLKIKFENLPTNKWIEICEINNYNIEYIVQWLINNIDSEQMDPDNHILEM